MATDVPEMHWGETYHRAGAGASLRGRRRALRPGKDPLRDRPRNVGQCPQELHALQTPEMGQLIPLFPHAEVGSGSCLEQALWSWS